MSEEAEYHAGQYQRTCGDPDLAFERHRFLTAYDGQSGLIPGLGSAINADGIGKTGLLQLLARLLAASPRNGKLGRSIRRSNRLGT